MKQVPTLVKWAGGKKQLLDQFKPLLPNKVDRYFEPFLGGGAFAFYIIKNFKPNEVILSDINEELINVYNIVKSNYSDLIKELKRLKSKNTKKSFYNMRSKNPQKLSDVERAGRFIFLNKCCFNGLYRVNSKGEFNVPYGDYSNPAILMEEDLKEISQLLKNIQINNSKFEDVLNDAKKGDFIYFDPPYYPLNKTSFTKYAKGSFLEEEHKKLCDVFKELDKRGCLVMLSNSDSQYIKDLYKDFNINIVKASRMINRDASKRGKINEIVVTNYLGVGSPKKLNGNSSK